MAHSSEKILSLLPLLDEQIADQLESETLDFKECPTEAKLRELAKEMAICFGNASRWHGSFWCAGAGTRL